jgi:hypothetical protein
MLQKVRDNPRVIEFARRHPGLLKAAQKNRAIYDVARGRSFTAPLDDANPLEQYFRTHPGRLISKWHHYFDVYDRHLSPYRGKDLTLVEFGVFHGGSLQMWKNYFGPGARIIGVDINPDCAQLAEDQIEIVIGDQEDREFLADLAARIGPIDVVIEDGGHRMTQQVNTLETFWPNVVDGGVFISEDLHTSYWENYGGGLRRPDTFIEYSKKLIDQMHAWHSRDDTFAPDDFTRTLRGMSVYDSMIVFEKADVQRPRNSRTGTPSFPTDD